MKAPLVAIAAMLAAGTALAQPIDTAPRIAVVSAFQPEWVVLRGRMQDITRHDVHGIRFLTGTLAGKPVVLYLSGVSMVNATMTTQMAIDLFNIEGIVFSGIAGGVDPALSIGDVVVAARWSQYLESAFARETADGFALPDWMAPSELENYGMIFPRQVKIARGDAPPEEIQWFPADPAYLQTATEVARDVSLLDCADAGACLPHRPQIVVGGNGVSGQAFVDNADIRDWISRTFDAQVVDMESAAVAHVAHVNKVPFIAFRSLSDLAGGGEGGNEMATFMSLASANSAAVVEAFLARLD